MAVLWLVSFLSYCKNTHSHSFFGQAIQLSTQYGVGDGDDDGEGENEASGEKRESDGDGDGEGEAREKK